VTILYVCARNHCKLCQLVSCFVLEMQNWPTVRIYCHLVGHFQRFGIVKAAKLWQWKS